MDTAYLDHAATTPLREEVAEAMQPYGSEVFGNPSSLHRRGREAHAALEGARDEIAAALGCRSSEIRFVRGGTESDNLAILGSCRAKHRRTGVPTPLVVSAVEHSAVLEAARHAEAVGDAVLTVVDVDPDGGLDLEAVVRGLEPAGDPTGPEERAGREPIAGTVSVMWANNETGLVLPVESVVESVRDTGATVHTDASQALGKVPVDVDEVPVDLVTATGHKLGGPRGMAILFVRDGTELESLHFGGGQERGLRPGTEDVAGAVGLATAIRLAVEELEEAARRMEGLRDRLEGALSAAIDGLRINGSEGRRAPHVSSVGIPGVADGQALLMALDLEGVAVSGGSACQSGAGGGSHVVAAMYGADDTLATVRFSFGRSTTEAEVDRAVAATTTVVERLRETAEDAA